MNNEPLEYNTYYLSEWLYCEKLVTYQMMYMREGVYVVVVDNIAKELIKYLKKRNLLLSLENEYAIRCLCCENAFIVNGSICKCYEEITHYHNYYFLVSEKYLPNIEIIFKKIRISISAQKRKSLEQEAEGHHTKDTLKVIYNLQAGLCYYCMVPINNSSPNKYTIDHIIPLSSGGSHWPNNIALTCKKCNSQKSWTSEKDFIKEIRRVKSDDWVADHKEFILFIKKQKKKVFASQMCQEGLKDPEKGKG